ncbi:hypothetical protein SLEP1_g53439 [Rubroshorea leprosula]|uniref:Uncharacterized protein n=1 Tax=Rubroshorea leprosula TaxID=152421 RepID=A0AAV5MC77_9ROSI|nr:hypothetical protein SLEP1_g53439 [Rubroshorea leprosula]
MKPRVSLLLLLPYTEQEPQPPPTPPHLRETGKSLKFSPSFPCSRTGIEPRIIPPSAESQICSALLLPAAALLCEGANCSSFCAASPLQIVAGLPPNCSSGFACRILLNSCRNWLILAAVIFGENPVKLASVLPILESAVTVHCS